MPQPDRTCSRPALLLLLLLAVGTGSLVVTMISSERSSDGPSYLRGVNAAGAEFDSGIDFDSDASFEFYADRGHKIIRLPIRWEAIQRAPGADLDPDYLARLKQAVHSSTSRGMTTIVDVHNYHRYHGEVVDGSAVTRFHLADLWAKLAVEFAKDPLVEFGLMNEPHDVPGGARGVEEIAQTVVTAIRATGAENFIWVSGDEWSSAASFADNHPTWWIEDPLDRSGPEAHYYFDTSNQRRGTYPHSIQHDEAMARRRGFSGLTDMVQEELGRFVAYCKRDDLRCLIGEIGWPNGTSASRHPDEAAAWNAVAEVAYQALDAGGVDVTYWAAGEAWQDSYNLSIYAGRPQSRTTSVASVVEAHGSRGDSDARAAPRWIWPLSLGG